MDGSPVRLSWFGIAKQVIFDRGWVAVIYAMITIGGIIEVTLHGSIGLAGTALAACAISVLASSTFVSCFLARHEQHYSARDLCGIAAIAISLTLVSLALAGWCGFRLILYGIEVSGPQWAIAGSIVGAVVAKRELLT